MEIEVPSSTDFPRQPPPSPQCTPRQAKKPAKPRAPATTRLSPPSDPPIGDVNAQNNTRQAVKQSKSRNGCGNCKKKRVKCDEAKPTCDMCRKRNLQCDGYKINFKWRSFDDSSKPSHAGKTNKSQPNTAQKRAVIRDDFEIVAASHSIYSEDELSWSPGGPQSVCAYVTHPGDGFLTPAVGEQTPEELTPSNFDPLSDLTSAFADSDVEILPFLPISRTQSPNRYDKEFDGNVNRTISFAHETNNPQWRSRSASPPNSQNSTMPSHGTSLSLFTSPYFDPSSPEMLFLRFDKETCGILSIKDGSSENPWRTIIGPLAKDSRALYHAISAMAALHGATTQPRLRLIGMTHMTKSISKLSTEMHEMSLNQILASALALCLSEGWDDKISTGIQHLKGAKTVLNNALARRTRSLKLGQLSREEAEPLKFLSNTFVYLDAIARLTSTEDHDSIDLDNTVQAVNESTESEIDPLMGCATTLFPILGKVGSLIQRVRRSSTNSLSIISEANELREQLLQWEPPDMYSFEQPEDPSSNVRHILQTAEAYRRAILLHLHSAVTELSSEPSYDQAKGTLAMLAATPLSSRTMIVQIFPLLVGSCEMVEPDDRHWVAQRWDAMMKRLSIVSVSACWKVVKEVWRRRDQWVETQAQQFSSTIGQNVFPWALFTPAKKRNVDRADSATEDTSPDNLAASGEMTQDCSNRAHKRNHTFDTSRSLVPKRNLVQLPRRHTDVSLLSGRVEYTVRGQLHWLGVMSDWNWEVFL